MRSDADASEPLAETRWNAQKPLQNRLNRQKSVLARRIERAFFVFSPIFFPTRQTRIMLE